MTLISALRKKFYPLGYKEKALIEWQGLKLRKGKTVQEYMNGFRKMALILEIPLHTQENIMKNIGGFPTHIRNLYLYLDLLILMRFIFKKHTLRQRKHELVYQGNHLQEKRTKGSGMARRQI
jgi:hypothetical protein